MNNTMQMYLRELLPDVSKKQDSRVGRLVSLLECQIGIIRADVDQNSDKLPTLVLEFDSARRSVEDVESLVQTLAAEIYSESQQGSTDRHAAGATDEAGSLTKSGSRDVGWYSRNTEFIWSLAAGALIAVAWCGQTWLGFSASVVIPLYIAAYVLGGFDLIANLLRGLMKGRFRFDIDLLMLLAAIGAAFLGAWVEGAFLLFLFSLAHAMEHYALGRARNAIHALSDLAPAKAIIKRDGVEQEVLVEQVRVGETVIVHPAQRIPVDGKVRAGHSAVDQAPITGESVPVEKSPGDEVFAGTVNGTGALEVVTTSASGDRTLDRVVRMVQEAQTQKAPTQRFTDKFESVFVPLVLIVDVLIIVVPPLLSVWPWETSFYRGMAFLVAASPCALALGTPSAVLAGIAQAARKGVLIKGGAHLEALGSVRAIAFDKTGTLTVGKPEVTDLRPMTGVTESELLRITAAVERRSQHPLAAAVVRRAEADGIAAVNAEDVQSVTARGVRSNVEGKVVEIGSLRMFEADADAIPTELTDVVNQLQLRGRSVMVVRYDGQWLGVIGLADAPRPSARQTLNRLRELGVETLVMLTGDNAGVAKAVGSEIGVDQIKAGLLPEDKVAAMQELLAVHGQVVMVGDGVNDAPALANATVGIAMGGAGTAAALETADVALMGDDLSRLPFAIGLSRSARRIIHQNLAIALGTIVLLAIATTLGFAKIGPAVVFHEGSTLVVIFNSLRLLAYNEDLDEQVAVE